MSIGFKMMQNAKNVWHQISERPSAAYSYQPVSSIPLAERCPDAERDGVVSDSCPTWPSMTLLTEQKPDVLKSSSGPTPSSDRRTSKALLGLLCAFRSLRAVLVYMIPSFLQNIWMDKDPESPRKVPPTAYLNGLRGLAAFLVFTQHYMTDYYLGEHHWGYHARRKDLWTTKLPGLRLIHCGGSFAVAIFYVLSGYVLAYKPLQHVRQSDEGALMNNMTSAIFRRALRLFLPLLPPLLLTAVLVWGGIYGDWKHMRSRKSIDGSLWSEFWSTIWVFKRLANPFPLDVSHPPTIPPLYTIPVEFRGSIMVFTMVIGLAKVTPTFRMTSFAIVSIIALLNTRWDSFAFMNGVILAELRYIRNESTFKLEDIFKNPLLLRVVKTLRLVFWLSILALAIFLGSWPAVGSSNTPGYKTLATWTPSSYHRHAGPVFWYAIAAVLLLYPLENLEALQRPFASAFMRYIGDISFSLYVLHFPVLLTVGRRITLPLIHATGKMSVGVVAGGFLLLPVLIWASDLQWRACDMGSVRFAKWLERRFFSRPVVHKSIGQGIPLRPEHILP